MPDVVIRAEGLGKKYVIGHQAERAPYTTLRDIIMRNAKGLWRKTKDLVHGRAIVQGDELEEVWALKDVSFEINQGETIGIIGRNGAGKSTLLKILSRITEPTVGCAYIFGRVSSLLEVGTGFHPELTGRENIYLSGAILGMKRKELTGKFDEIVAFAEIDNFLDTPVKHYSSGMYMRLAFAVAAHLEPEILLVDEVLAVGDAQFQKKCIGKLGDVAKRGRTILFVSHNMAAITTMCNQCILLESGRISHLGKTSDVVLQYYSKGASSAAQVDFPTATGDELADLLSGSIKNIHNEIVSEIDINDPLKICMRFRVLKKTSARFLPQFHFVTAMQIHAFAAYFRSAVSLDPGEYTVECLIPPNFMNDQTYFVGLGLGCVGVGHIKNCFYEEGALSFNVKDPIEDTPGPRGEGYTGGIPGAIRPQFVWELQQHPLKIQGRNTR